MQRQVKKRDKPFFDLDVDQLGAVLPAGLLHDLLAIVQTFVVRPLELNVGSLIRDYQGGGRMSHLDAHPDNGDDEISASLQFMDDSFLFVHPDPARESERGPPGTYHCLKPKNATLERFARSPLPVVHMTAGELVVFEGFKHWHGCRYLKEGERRVAIILFYKIAEHAYGKEMKL